MDASDLIKSLQRQPCEEGAVHIWGPDADWRAKLLIYRVVEGSILDAYSHLNSGHAGNASVGPSRVNGRGGGSGGTASGNCDHNGN
jgi:hypothetical protein